MSVFSKLNEKLPLSKKAFYAANEYQKKTVNELQEKIEGLSGKIEIESQENAKLLSVLEELSRTVEKLADMADVQNHRTGNLVRMADVQFHRTEDLVGMADAQFHRTEDLVGMADAQFHRTEDLVGMADIQFHRTEDLVGMADAQFHRTEDLVRMADAQFHQIEDLVRMVDAQFHRIEDLVRMVDAQFHRTEDLMGMADTQFHRTEELVHGKDMLLNKVGQLPRAAEYPGYAKYLLYMAEKSIKAALLHPISFAGYQNKYMGRDVVICGAGPTLNFYKPHKNAVFIALNRSFLLETVRFHYIFCQDFRGISRVQEELAAYKGDECVKFFGYQDGNEDSEIPESFARRCHAIRFISDIEHFPDGSYSSDNSRFALDISREPLGNYWSIAFSALQFALYTNPRRLYLVGIDMAGPHFNEERIGVEADSVWQTGGRLHPVVQRQWMEFKRFAQLHYPDMEIISVNPVGLKGLFQDEYTEEYLESRNKEI